jgi:hypothetical protein
MKQLLLSFIFLSLFSCASKKKQEDSDIKRQTLIMERLFAIEIELIEKENLEFTIDTELILKDTMAAVEVAEAILFSKYGKKKIKSQKPYTISRIKENYWLLEGSVPNSSETSPFFIILDARNAKVLKIRNAIPRAKM